MAYLPRIGSPSQICQDMHPTPGFRAGGQGGLLCRMGLGDRHGTGGQLRKDEVVSYWYSIWGYVGYVRIQNDEVLILVIFLFAGCM